MSVSFGGGFLPTKLELIRLRRSLEVSRNVYRILEDKREILIRQLDEFIEKASEARAELDEPLMDAYKSMFDAYLTLGPIQTESIASTTPSVIGVVMKPRSVMGIQVPSLEVEKMQVGLTYGFSDSNSALDLASLKFRKIVEVICRAAELENAIFRLAEELKKTQRLINALEYVVIPRYQNAIKFISSTLEEREREDFTKLKIVKRMLERGAA